MSEICITCFQNVNSENTIRHCPRSNCPYHNRANEYGFDVRTATDDYLMNLGTQMSAQSGPIPDTPSFAGGGESGGAGASASWDSGSISSSDGGSSD